MTALFVVWSKEKEKKANNDIGQTANQKLFFPLPFSASSSFPFLFFPRQAGRQVMLFYCYLLLVCTSITP